jgi:hypothetical protein
LQALNGFLLAAILNIDLSERNVSGGLRLLVTGFLTLSQVSVDLFRLGLVAKLVVEIAILLHHRQIE